MKLIQAREGFIVSYNISVHVNNRNMAILISFAPLKNRMLSNATVTVDAKT